MSFELKPDADNPDAYSVTELRTWNKTLLNTVWEKLKMGPDKGVKQALAGGKYEMANLRNGYLLVFTLNKDVPVRLVITRAFTGEMLFY